MTKCVTLEDGERIVAVVPEFCSGPGWQNFVTWLYIQGIDGKSRFTCVQPSERSAELLAIWNIGEVVSRELISSIPTKRKARRAAK